MKGELENVYTYIMRSIPRSRKWKLEKEVEPGSKSACDTTEYHKCGESSKAGMGGSCSPSTSN